MNAFRTTVLATALVAGLAGCQQHTAQAPTGANTTSTTGVGDGTGDGIGDTVERAMDHARVKLKTENVKLSENGHHAEISPTGDLIVDGKTIAVNADQRRLLIEHREHILDIASAGMDIGAQGAHLAGRAVSEAISGIFSGNTDRIHDRVEAQAAGMKKAAAALCDKLPAMYESQQRVAQAIPEFAPFATMKSSEQDKCHAEVNSDKGSGSESSSKPDAAPASDGTSPTPSKPTTADTKTS